MSNNPLAMKFLLILGVVAAAAFFAFPPQERINLGLDLRGGAHILMQVDTDDGGRVPARSDRQTGLGQRLKDAGIDLRARSCRPRTRRSRCAGPMPARERRRPRGAHRR